MAVDQTQLFFGGGKCLIFEVQLLAVDHAVAASPHAQCLCGTDTDLSRSRSVCNGVECFRQQDIAGQHGSGFSKCLVAGGFAAAQVIVVHAGQVIMDERIAVQHLNRRRKLLGCLGIAMEHIADGQHQYRTDALAAAHQAVAGRAADLGFIRQVGIARRLPVHG